MQSYNAHMNSYNLYIEIYIFILYGHDVFIKKKTSVLITKSNYTL